MQVYTIGHSNTPREVLLDQLLAAGVQRLVDIRRYPMSRRNPQFNRGSLSAALAEHDIEYVHMESLGGRRDVDPGSPNLALPEGIRGYADYMTTPDFAAAVDELLRLAEAEPSAVMCAEGDPAHCHRSLLADYLTLRGIEIVHLFKGEQRLHQLSPRARVLDGVLTYPALL